MTDGSKTIRRRLVLAGASWSNTGNFVAGKGGNPGSRHLTIQTNGKTTWPTVPGQAGRVS